MTVFGVHFCADEAYAILMCVPFLSYGVAWVRGRVKLWRDRHRPPACVHAEPCEPTEVCEECDGTYDHPQDVSDGFDFDTCYQDFHAGHRPGERRRR